MQNISEKSKERWYQNPGKTIQKLVCKKTKRKRMNHCQSGRTNHEKSSFVFFFAKAGLGFSWVVVGVTHDRRTPHTRIIKLRHYFSFSMILRRRQVPQRVMPGVRNCLCQTGHPLGHHHHLLPFSKSPRSGEQRWCIRAAAFSGFVATGDGPMTQRYM